MCMNCDWSRINLERSGPVSPSQACKPAGHETARPPGQRWLWLVMSAYGSQLGPLLSTTRETIDHVVDAVCPACVQGSTSVYSLCQG